MERIAPLAPRTAQDKSTRFPPNQERPLKKKSRNGLIPYLISSPHRLPSLAELPAFHLPLALPLATDLAGSPHSNSTSPAATRPPPRRPFLHGFLLLQARRRETLLQTPVDAAANGRPPLLQTPVSGATYSSSAWLLSCKRQVCELRTAVTLATNAGHRCYKSRSPVLHDLPPLLAASASCRSCKRRPLLLQ
jgi:hypothetical protein